MESGHRYILRITVLPLVSTPKSRNMSLHTRTHYMNVPLFYIIYNFILYSYIATKVSLLNLMASRIQEWCPPFPLQVDNEHGDPHYDRQVRCFGTPRSNSLFYIIAIKHNKYYKKERYIEFNIRLRMSLFIEQQLTYNETKKVLMSSIDQTSLVRQADDLYRLL